MPYQSAVTIRATIRPGQSGVLADWLAGVDIAGSRGQVFPFERLPVHFARFVVLNDDNDVDGNPLAASLMFSADVDGPTKRFLDRFVELARDGIDAAFGRCEGYPAVPTDRQRVRYLQTHAIKADAVYVNTVGRSVDQVHREARLRDAIEQFLDTPGRNWSGTSAEDVREAVRRFVAGDPSLSWALRPAPRPPLVWRLKEAVHLGLTVLALLLLLPVVVAVAPFLLVAIRLAERRDVPFTGQPSLERIRELAAREDWVVQNQFSAVGHLKPGWVRRVTVTVVLLGINLAARHVFNRGSLAGVRTIHFARWVFIDDRRRLIFTSNYDGSLESYMDDFIDKIAWSLNAAFSNGVGYPTTRWLIGKGAKDEQAFKRFLRSRQVPTQVWYSAYPDLTAANIANNAKIRAGLNGPADADQARAWARRL